MLGPHAILTWYLRLRASFPPENALKFAFVLIDASARVITTGKSKVTLRKLFVAITSLALKLVPGRPLVVLDASRRRARFWKLGLGGISFR